MSGPRAVRVELGARSYDVLVGRGLLAGAGARVAALGARRAAVVTDESVAALHLPALLASLEEAGLRATALALPPGESAKSYAGFERVSEAILSAGVERGDLVIALGGGVIGDLAGFAAASARRGVRLVGVPTTLLAQVDSSVGGKTGINSPRGKNLVGAFHQPSLVVADTALLDTLPAREMRAGYAEVVKYGLLGDAPFHDRLEAGAWRGLMAGGPEREEAVAACVAAKAGVVARDETEAGERMLLNLGHTFGHAIEALCGYDPARIVHGEAVAIGLAQAFRFSARLGLLAPEVPARVAAHLAAVGLPTRSSQVPGPALDPEGLLGAMRQDKKVSAGALTFVLARGIGAAFVARGVEEAAVLAFLREEAALPAG